jgi:hypothetical protein
LKKFLKQRTGKEVQEMELQGSLLKEAPRALIGQKNASVEPLKSYYIK